MEKIIKNSSGSLLTKDHLHIRGENPSRMTDATKELGSPPHTWRKLIRWNNCISKVRITSTYVEKINGKVISQDLMQDHLHIRGENIQTLK